MPMIKSTALRLGGKNNKYDKRNLFDQLYGEKVYGNGPLLVLSWFFCLLFSVVGDGC